MPNNILDELSTLQSDSGKRLPTSIIYGFSALPGGGSGSQLINLQNNGGGSVVAVPRSGIDSLLQKPQARRRLGTFDGSHGRFRLTLNKSLKGGESYPVLTTILGTATGLISGGAGLLFTATQLGISLGTRSTDVLARAGDEIWYIEEVGKSFEDNLIFADRYVPTHVSSYILVDPYRSKGGSNASEKGWLLHEQRKELIY